MPEPDPTSSREAPLPGRWWFVGLLFLASMINYLDRQTLSNLSKEIQASLHFDSNTQWGTLDTAFGLAFAFGSVFFGYLSDRFSVRWLYPVVVLGWSSAGILTGFVSNYHELLVCRAILGLFEAGHWPCALRMTQAVLAPRERGLGNSLLQGGTAIGAILTPMAILWMKMQWPGQWNRPFVVVGVVGSLWVFGWWAALPWLRRNVPEHAKTNPTEEETDGFGFIELLRDRRFWIVAVMVSLINISFHIARHWVPKMLRDERGWADTAALQFNSIYYLAADIGCMSAGAMTRFLSRSDRLRSQSYKIVFVTCALITTVVIFLPMLQVPEAATQGTSLWQHDLVAQVVLLTFIGSCLGTFPCYYSFAQEIATKHLGKVSGLFGCLAWVSVALVNPIVGAVIDSRKAAHAPGAFAWPIAIVGATPLFVAMLLPFWKDSEPQAETIEA